MPQKIVKAAIVVASLLSTIGSFPVHAATLDNWEGSHIDVSTENRAIDWWYTQIVSQQAASNGIPPSIEIVMKRGNTFQFGTSNSPLYSVDINGFDLDGQPFAQSFQFNTSSVGLSGAGLQTVGVWGNNEVVFQTSTDLKTFTVNLHTATASGSIVINSESHYRTGCGGTSLTDSPFFDSLVADGRPLTSAEDILYKRTGWRITAPAGPSKVNVNLNGKTLSFTGAGYKDSNWGPNAMNDFVRSWYVLIAQVGPWSFVTFSGEPVNGTNLINSAHLSYNGEFVTSQCNIIGERTTDISIIQPMGEILDGGVTAPTAFDVSFVLSDSSTVSFHATNIAVNPSVSVYHRWVAQYTGGASGGENYTSYGITEWMNPASLSHWPNINNF